MDLLKMLDLVRQVDLELRLEMRGLALDLEVRRVGNKQEGSVRSLKSEVQLLRCVIDAMKFFRLHTVRKSSEVSSKT